MSTTRPELEGEQTGHQTKDSLDPVARHRVLDDAAVRTPSGKIVGEQLNTSCRKRKQQNIFDVPRQIVYASLYINHQTK